MNFGSGRNGQDLASVELVGFAPTVGKWSFNFAVTYDSYPGAFDAGGDFSYVEIWTGVSRSFFDDELALTLYNYWSPEYFGGTGQNDVLELSPVWKAGYARKATSASGTKQTPTCEGATSATDP